MSTQIFQTPRRVSVSTWALHPLIGTVGAGRPGDADARMMTPRTDSTLDLLDVPAALAQRGIRTMEVCHFHIPSRDTDYLAKLRASAEVSGVEIWSLLIDDGDITDPVNGERDRLWTLEWIDAAGQIGAKCVRVIAGKQPPTDEALSRSRDALRSLVMEAYLRGVHVLTENWFALLGRPALVNGLLSEMAGGVGLCLDFGNWDDHAAAKYDDLAAIAAWAESCHAKCRFTGGKPEAEDFVRCLEITKSVDFSGPYTLVHGEAADVSGSIELQRRLVAPFCEQPRVQQ